MSKYIDANRLMERYKATCDIVCQYSKEQRDTMCVSCGLGSAIEVLEDFPTTDVVEVVRCKDCKHADWVYPYCTIWDAAIDGEWYCYKGEKE